MIFFCVHRQVPLDEAQKFSCSVGIPYIECSAKLGINVVEAFHELVRIVRKFQIAERPFMDEELRQKKKRRCCIL